MICWACRAQEPPPSPHGVLAGSRRIPRPACADCSRWCSGWTRPSSRRSPAWRAPSSDRGAPTGPSGLVPFWADEQLVLFQAPREDALLRELQPVTMGSGTEDQLRDLLASLLPAVGLSHLPKNSEQRITH